MWLDPVPPGNENPPEGEVFETDEELDAWIDEQVAIDLELFPEWAGIEDELRASYRRMSIP